MHAAVSHSANITVRQFSSFLSFFQQLFQHIHLVGAPDIEAQPILKVTAADQQQAGTQSPAADDAADEHVHYR